MFGIQHPKKGSRSFALFDIGTSSIGVAVGVESGADVKVVWSKRVEYGYDRDENYEHYLKSMYATLLEVGMAMMSEGMRIAQRDSAFHIRHLEVVCIFSPPWFFGAVRTTVRTSEKRRTISHGFIDEMRGALYAELLTLPEYHSWQDVAGAGELMEQHDLSLHLDGYRVVESHEYDEAHEAMLTAYLAVAPETVLRKVSEIIQRTLPNHSVRMTTSTRLLASYRKMQAKSDAVTAREMLVEVGGQVTSVGVLESGVLSGITVFPSGTHHLVRACAPDAKSVDEAMSIAFSIAKQSSGENATLPPPVLEALSVWSDMLHDAVRSATRGVTPPLRVAMAVKSGWYTLYAHALETEWQQPGLREARGFTVYSCDDEPPPPTLAGLGQVSDVRLYTLMCAVARIVT